MYIFKLALRNLLGAGLRTWLNAFILSLSFVIIIGCQALYKGMGRQMERAAIDSYYGGGQYWQENYDPFDNLTLDDAHGRLPDELAELIAAGQAAPLLKRQATLYPRGRVLNITLNGIDPEQTVLNIPAAALRNTGYAIPAIIGGKMAKSAGLKQGDTAVLRWRDVRGTFDAEEIYIAGIMPTNVIAIDQGQVWIPLAALRKMTGLPGQATLAVLSKELQTGASAPGWIYKSQDFLLTDERAMISSEYVEASVMYAVFLFLAMLGIFDTQLLAIFRRVKEMGTMLALGVTKADLLKIFTLEGTLHSALAALLALIYGMPLLFWFNKTGFRLAGMDQFGLALDNVIYPIFTPGIIFGTAVLIFGLTALVSYLPCRRIARLTPTDALRGKIV
ncbi:MAG: FtsX-like permease family protein [Candidatus Margulisbacteria bacterium]|nr:FtsX-like permease family protein [Candidatus Margulisiibacteriota bacterium]